jgi:hypothetical protein
MALSGSTIWEVRTDGSDTNGGGFVEGASGTDYSQQATPQLTVTDGACLASTTLTSATGGFTAAMIGNILYLSNGTAWYEITGYTDTNTVTIDRAGPSASGMTANVGGGLASPGGLGAVTLAHGATGMAAFIKGGTYTLTTATPNITGGPFQRIAASMMFLTGYNTTHGDLDYQAAETNKPIIHAGAITGVSKILECNTGSYSYHNRVANIVIDGNNGAGNTGFSHNSASGHRTSTNNVNCHAKNCVTGFEVPYGYACESYDCTTGFNSGSAHHSVAHDCSGEGFTSGATLCLSYSNNVGFGGAGHLCTAVNNTTYGMDVRYNSRAYFCHASLNGTYGFKMDASRRCIVIGCTGYGNTSALFDNPPGGHIYLRGSLEHPSTPTADPFVDEANNDYRLNDSADAGLALRASVLGAAGQTQTLDCNAIQTAAGGGGLLRVAMNGGMNG